MKTSAGYRNIRKKRYNAGEKYQGHKNSNRHLKNQWTGRRKSIQFPQIEKTLVRSGAARQHILKMIEEANDAFETFNPVVFLTRPRYRNLISFFFLFFFPDYIMFIISKSFNIKKKKNQFIRKCYHCFSGVQGAIFPRNKSQRFSV